MLSLTAISSKAIIVAAEIESVALAWGDGTSSGQLSCHGLRVLPTTRNKVFINRAVLFTDVASFLRPVSGRRGRDSQYGVSGSPSGESIGIGSRPADLNHQSWDRRQRLLGGFPHATPVHHAAGVSVPTRQLSRVVHGELGARGWRLDLARQDEVALGEPRLRLGNLRPLH